MRAMRVEDIDSVVAIESEAYEFPWTVGIFRDVRRPTYDDLVREQVGSAVAQRGGSVGDGDLNALIAGRDTWTVGA